MADPDDEILEALDFSVEHLVNEPSVHVEETEALKRSFRYILELARLMAIETYDDMIASGKDNDFAKALAEIAFHFVIEYMTMESD